MTNKERFEELQRLLPVNKYRAGDVVLAYGKPRLITHSSGGLVVVGKGRGYTMHLSHGNIERLIVRNYRLKPGYSFCGVKG